MNVLLIIGVLSIVSTFIFLYMNLERADKVLIWCVPGFFVGFSLITIYYFGYFRIRRTGDRYSTDR